MKQKEQERRRGHVYGNKEPCTGTDVSNADLPDRQSSQGVGVYVSALPVTAGRIDAVAVLSGSFRQLRTFFVPETQKNRQSNEIYKERRSRK